MYEQFGKFFSWKKIHVHKQNLETKNQILINFEVILQSQLYHDFTLKTYNNLLNSILSETLGVIKSFS